MSIPSLSALLEIRLDRGEPALHGEDLWCLQHNAWWLDLRLDRDPGTRA